MRVGKALFHVSLLSCLELRAPICSSPSLCRLSYTLTSHSVMRIKPYQLLFPATRRFGGQRATAVSPDMLDCTVAHDDESDSDCCNDTVEGLLDKNKDDISRLMKMERRELPCDRDGDVHPWFPYLDRWKGENVSLNSGDILEAMGSYLMDSRRDRLRNAVNNRSYSVCLVVEGLSDFGNISAAFRSADALGIQSVHVVSYNGSRRYRDNRHVSMGAEKWLDIELWNSVQECYDVLKARGYRIVVASLGGDAVSAYDINWCCPTAIVVGNEHRGISKDALELSDLRCSIPMRGMVDSFNVSVAAGLLMHHAVYDRTLRMGTHGDLTPQQRQILLAEFYLRHNKNAVNIATNFFHRKSM